MASQSPSQSLMNFSALLARVAIAQISESSAMGSSSISSPASFINFPIWENIPSRRAWQSATGKGFNTLPVKIMYLSEL